MRRSAHQKENRYWWTTNEKIGYPDESYLIARKVDTLRMRRSVDQKENTDDYQWENRLSKWTWSYWLESQYVAHAKIHETERKYWWLREPMRKQVIQMNVISLVGQPTRCACVDPLIKKKDTGSIKTEWGEFWLYLPISDIPLLGGLGKQIIRSGVIEYNHVENPNTTHAGTAHIVYTTPPLLTSVDSYNLMTTRLD